MKIENLNLSALKYFLDAVEMESITLSSERNHISRPAVSQAILRLEEWYGKQLLSHEKRRFSLTEEGKQFYRVAKKSFDTLEDGLLKKHDPEYALKIGCSASLIDLVFPKIQGQIDKYPEAIIKVGPTLKLMQMLEDEEINLAFLISSSGKVASKSFEFHSGHFELRSKSGKLTDTLILTETRPEVVSFLKYAVKSRINFARKIEVESWTVASRLAEMANGTCLVPNYIFDGQLRAVPIKNWKFKYSAQVIYKRESLLSKTEVELIKYLKKNL